MKTTFLKRRKFWKRLILITLVLPVLLFSILLLVVYWKQDELIQGEIEAMNKTHKGLIEVGDTHLAPFENFPYISIKVDDVKIYESKEDNSPIILDVADIYVGFDIWDIVAGDYDVQKLLVEDGYFNIIKHKDGSINLQNALATPDDGVEEEEEPLDIHLKKIELRNLDIHKLDESTMMDVETYIYWADGGFKTGSEEIAAHIDTEFELNVIDNGDTTYIKHKHFEFHTDLTLNEETGLLAFEPSGITMEHGDFELEGSIDTKNDMTVDLMVRGKKPNFDMMIAFAPEDLIPVLERYNNAGNIYFNAVIMGPTADGAMPFIDAEFGASEAFLENTQKGKRVDEVGFKGHFTNGRDKTLESMEFSITDITAKPETGIFKGSVLVRNFVEPEIDMELHADFNLEFLAEFFNLSDITALGNIKLDMKFHDIIDLDNPEKALENLNQAYFSELRVRNLRVVSADLPVPIDKLNMHVAMNGKRGEIDQFELLMGKTDLSITGYLSDLPAIIHHTNIPVEAHLEIESKALDLAQLTGFPGKDSSGVDERIEDLSVAFSFKSTAQEFTESKYLPKGEFFVDRLHAQLKHYPHELHDFHVDVLIDETDMKIVDFTGYIDESDFHFNGDIDEYEFWMRDTLNGDVNLDITLASKMLKLEDIFTYQGENYVPEDYRHEEFDDLTLHLNTAMHFRNSELHSIDMDLDRFDTKMHIHPMRFENFAGRIHYEDEHIVIEKLHGKIGRTVFDMDLNYYLGEDEAIKKRDNHFGLKANYMDFDQLFAFNTSPPSTSTEEKKEEHTTDDVEEHAEAFNIYELPFTDMTIDLDVGHFIYHRVDLQNIHTRLRTTHDHYLYVDTMSMNAAGGRFLMSGYFNGSDPEHIYLKPDLRVENADLDRLMFKFENFGQDEVVSDNLHGKLTADITGNIRVYPDMVPDLDQSEIHMDVEILNGRLDNYEPVLMLSEYMGDKNLESVRFDTLKNHMDITNGVMTIPNMTIESTLGHYELSGTQTMDEKIDYYFRIPWKIIKEGARYKLFGEKRTSDGEVGDDQIIEKDPKENVRYLNLRIVGTIDDYEIKMSKPKK